LDTYIVLRGQRASLTFKDPGVYSYNCAAPQHEGRGGGQEVATPSSDQR